VGLLHYGNRHSRVGGKQSETEQEFQRWYGVKALGFKGNFLLDPLLSGRASRKRSKRAVTETNTKRVSFKEIGQCLN